MVNMLRRIVVAVAFVAAFGLSASAQFSFGLKAGVAVSDLKFSEDVLEADNRAGFTGGVMAEFMIPMTNIGLDASLMYVRRNSEFGVEYSNGEKVEGHRDYIEVPVNLKWKIGVPVIASIVKPYVFTGPSFAFLTSKKDIENVWKNKSVDVSWNVGFGVELMSKLQVGASYGFGITKAVEIATSDGAGVQGVNIDGKNRYWTITAAYLF